MADHPALPADATAQAVIARLGLAPHPEGGWYRQTWRAGAGSATTQDRPIATAIHFLLEAHQRSHWHRVDADELWFWHAGAPIALSIASGVAPVEVRPVEVRPVEVRPVEVRLGPDVLAGDRPQALVPAHSWQAAAPQGGWALVSCVVAPGFEFAGFELAPPDWMP